MFLMSFSTMNAISKDKKKDWHKKGFYIKGFGWGALAEGGTVRPYSQYRTYVGYDTTFEINSRRVGFSFLYIGWNSHFLLKQFGKEKSISLNFYPTIGLGAIENRFLNVSLPLMLCLNKGNVSTYSSKKDGGITFGLGAEFIRAGLFKVVENEQTELNGFRSKILNIVQPCANIGLRYFTHADHAQEINVKFGLRRDRVYDEIYHKRPLLSKSIYTDFWFRLTMVHYIRY